MHEIGVIFTHHNTDFVTVQNYQSIKRHNPGIPIIPISSDHHFPNSLDCSQDERWIRITENKSELTWLNNDLKIYFAYQNGHIKCKRWIVIEWDTYCNMPLEKFFEGVIDADVAGSAIHIGEKFEKWHWNTEKSKLPENIRPYAAGMSPMTCLLFSDKALSAIVGASKMLETSMLCEFRIATLANYLGFKICSIPKADSNYNIKWTSVPPELTKLPGIWHTVKYLL